MTPTAISTLIMYAILTASTSDVSNVQHEQVNVDSYNVKHFQVDGLDTVTYIDPTIKRYAIHFDMNNIDNTHTQFKPYVANENMVFWNFPGVGESKGIAHSVYDLIDAGYAQVKRLINQQVPAEHITLVGRSLGGGVAIHVARRLHQEGYPVNLTIDRTFSQIARVLSSYLEENLLINHPKTAPFLTSLIAFSFIGIASGTTLAGLMATLGLSFSISISAVGYIIAETTQIVGNIFATFITIVGQILACPFFIISEGSAEQIKELFFTIAYNVDLAFASLGYYINYCVEGVALSAYSIINSFSAICGSLIGLAGGLIGIAIGVVFGSVASLQLLTTDKPYFFPTDVAFSALLISTCCELNAVDQIQRLIATSKQNQVKPVINVHNTLDDEIIRTPAALANGLGVSPPASDSKSNITKTTQSGSVNCFWYQKGGHTDQLSQDDLLIKATLN